MPSIAPIENAPATKGPSPNRPGKIGTALILWIIGIPIPIIILIFLIKGCMT